jgi:hypothetical protein
MRHNYYKTIEDLYWTGKVSEYVFQRLYDDYIYEGILNHGAPEIREAKKNRGRY